MEKLDYKELLNQNAKNRYYMNLFFKMVFGCNFYFYWKMLNSHNLHWVTPLIIIVCVLYYYLLLSEIPMVYKEKKRIINTILLYNDYVETNTFYLVEDELRDIYCRKARNWIFYKYTSIWECKFVYEDEEQVCKSDKGDVYIGSGYFKDMSGKKDRKVKYSIIFKDNEQYMSNIDNLILLNYKKGLPAMYDRGKIYAGKIGPVLWRMFIFMIIFIIYVLYDSTKY